MSSRIASQRFRQRKLSVKQTLAVLHERDTAKLFDDDGGRHIPRIETGVEKGEEIEHHLQAVISASKAEGGKPQRVYIPTPDTTLSSIQYDGLYPPRFKTPSTFIKFSSTVEDCIGASYCMDNEDQAFLKSMNSGGSNGDRCTEDQFEQIMDALEETTRVKQPFASLDPNTPVLTLAELDSGFEDIAERTRKFIPNVYEHWKVRRSKTGNQPVMPSLKFERNETVDEMDPYVCFRRREIRQTRKTRGRDVMVSDKLKKMRCELELARQLLYLVSVKEKSRQSQLANERRVFEQRRLLCETMRSLGIKDGDMSLLIDQPPARQIVATAAIVPKTPVEQTVVQNTKPAVVPRPAPQRSTEVDLVLYEDLLNKREQRVGTFITESIERHRAWNHGFIDFTWQPITPPHEPDTPSLAQFCSATVTDLYLPTPPMSVASVKDRSSDEQYDQDLPPALTPISGPFTPDCPKDDDWRPPKEAEVVHQLPGPRVIYRRRMARGGRLLLDRKLVPFSDDSDNKSYQPTGWETSNSLAKLSRFDLMSDGEDEENVPATDDRMLDRFRYDHDSDDDDVNILGYTVQYVDPYSANSIKYRALMSASMARDLAAAQLQQQQAQQAQARQLQGLPPLPAGQPQQAQQLQQPQPPQQPPPQGKPSGPAPSPKAGLPPGQAMNLGATLPTAVVAAPRTG